MKKSQATKGPKYWLIKSEPITYSIDHLKADKTTPWSGVRNYQARNYMRDQMSVGDLCLFYHSNTASAEMGIAGLAKVASKPYLDPAAKDKKSPYYEPNPKIEWQLVDMRFVKKFKRIMTLKEIKLDPKLKNMMVVQKGSRLSIQPVRKEDFEYIVKELE